MNPLTNVKNLQKLNERELALGLTTKKSWHDQYKDSAWIFVGGLPYDLSEGDILCVFSQYGEVVNINLVRDQKSGKSKGFCFICYEDQRSTILSVDNLNGFKLLGRILRVDHVEDYKKPKDHGDEDDVTRKLRDDGCAPRVPSSPELSPEEDPMPVKTKKAKKIKKDKKKKKKKKKVKDSTSESESSSDDEQDTKFVKVKKEKYDPGYDKAEMLIQKRSHSPDTNENRQRQKYSRLDRYSPDRNMQRDYGSRDGQRVMDGRSDFRSRRDENWDNKYIKQERRSDSEEDVGRYRKQQDDRDRARDYTRDRGRDYYDRSKDRDSRDRNDRSKDRDSRDRNDRSRDRDSRDRNRNRDRNYR